ncbi:MAG TPA: sigma-70 family RNA polymerase sigma factor [Longimicrobiaceae bacterium]|nr:sigma-70 family RNA polymerase sigma factor [Longimicrobiaceae bacterium]
MTESDAVLVGRARGGSPEAFEALVRRHLKAAYAVALAQLGEAADAEDVCQDAFVTALKRIEECRKPDQFGAWLLAIVRNRAHDIRRRRSIREALPLDTALTASGGPDPQREAERSQLREDLVGAMDGLSETQREVVLLHDFEGWSHREIGEKLGISDGSARVHLFRARKTLRERLSGRHKEET